ncbi:hypothetical protein C8R47DRAFT_1230646 [Mycena vitilis]|nr:hypothetical protein C8R47DRAFT_1230646 [Mycena vitilis]
MDRSRDPYAVLLAKLAGISSPPKARQAFQQYMHEAYETEILPIVTARWKASSVEADGVTLRTKKGPDAPFRAKVARELFSELSDEEQDALRQRAKEDGTRAREEYFAAMKNGASKAPADRQRCIDGLGGFMSIILRGVAEYTGLHGVAIFGGPMPQYAGEIRTVTVSYGRNHGPSPCHWAHWSKARFARDVLAFMKEYLHTAFTPEECAEAALPDDDGLANAKWTITPEDMEDRDDVPDPSDSESSSSDSDDSASDDLDSEVEEDVRALRGKAKSTGKKDFSIDVGWVPRNPDVGPRLAGQHGGASSVELDVALLFPTRG